MSAWSHTMIALARRPKAVGEHRSDHGHHRGVKGARVLAADIRKMLGKNFMRVQRRDPACGQVTTHGLPACLRLPHRLPAFCHEGGGTGTTLGPVSMSGGLLVTSLLFHELIVSGNQGTSASLPQHAYL